MATRPGFEPGQRESKSLVLPLHHRVGVKFEGVKYNPAAGRNKPAARFWGNGVVYGRRAGRRASLFLEGERTREP